MKLDGESKRSLARARENWQAGRYEPAIAHLEQIACEGFRDACRLFAIAVAQLKLGRAEAAFETLRAAAPAFEHSRRAPPPLIALDDGDPDYQLALGALLRDLGRLEAAHAALRCALRIRPGHPQTVYHLGLFFVVAGDQAAAREQYVELARLDESLARALYDRVHF